MPISYSVAVQASVGYNTVTLPSPGVLVGVYHFAQYLSIPIDASHTAIIPGRPATLTTKPTSKPYAPVFWPINANSFQFYVPQASLVVFYFGVPDSDAVSLSDLVGVVQTVTFQNSATSATVMSTTVTFSFLSRARLIGALCQVQDTNGGPYQFSFNALPGYTLTLGSDWTTGLALDLGDVIPLANIPVAQQLSVSVSASVAASSTSSAVIIFYYRVV